MGLDYDNQLNQEAAVLGTLGDTPETRGAVTTLQQLRAIGALGGTRAQQIETIGRLPTLHTQVESAIHEDNVQFNETVAEQHGHDFSDAVERARTNQVNWENNGQPNGVIDHPDNLVNVAQLAEEMDLTAVPGPVAEGIQTMARLKGVQEEADIESKQHGTILEERGQAKEQRTILKNGLKQFGWYVAHLAPGVASALTSLIPGFGPALWYLIGTGALAEAVGGVTLAFNEKLHSLRDANEHSRQSISDARGRIAGIRLSAVAGNNSLVGAISDLQDELFATQGYTDPNGNVIHDVKHDDRMKAAYQRRVGIPKDVRSAISAFASA